MQKRIVAAILVLLCAMLTAPSTADAQIMQRIRNAAKEAVAGEAGNQVDRLIRNAIRCVADDPVCVEKAQASGNDVIFVDDNGAVIVDADGAPITAREDAIAAAPPVAPGQGAWANYDFVPGDEILFLDDFSDDRVGDFPRRLDLIQGNWEVIEWEGGRYLRATSNGLLAIPLPKTLPERFTVEYQVNIMHGNGVVQLLPGRAIHGPARNYRGSSPTAGVARGGVRPVGGVGPESMMQYPSTTLRDAIVPFRVTADGEHMKVYLGEKRIANMPNAVFPRSDTLFLAVSSARESHPVMIGGIRIAAGGRDLYDRLERDGRVATQGILFATNSDRIRPESTPTLEEIGTMLAQHSELRIRIEGHTDSEGEDGYNQQLSELRAAAVRTYLLEKYGVDGQRLETAGFGETQPVADNATPEGRQQNRRVELVRL